MQNIATPETIWKFYLSPFETWQAVLANLEEANFSIDFEQYIFEVDEIGQKFVDLFIQKARAGLKVRLLLDYVGSINSYNTQAIKAMTLAGVQILFYNVISPWRLHNFSSWFFRDHNKIAIIDKKIAFTGGVGVRIGMRDWRDTQVRIAGPVLEAFNYSFDRMWQVASTNKKFLRFKLPSTPAVGFEFLINSPYQYNKFIKRKLSAAILSAQEYIYISTPYFIPDLSLFRSLRLAAKRGVDVRILLPKNSDHILLDIAAQSYFGLAMKSGIKIFFYDANFLHAKSAVIDDSWATVGSTNMDNLSFIYNFEGNIVSVNKSFALELKQHFLSDLNFSKQLSPEEWNDRPLIHKILEPMTWPFHNVL